jgi:protein archease
MMDRAGFEELEHTADWSLRIWGPTMAALLESGVTGLMALMGLRVLAAGGTERQVELHSQDPESLLVAWLEDLLFALETRQVAPGRIKLTAGDTWLRATLEEVPAGPIGKPVKAVTYHQLKIETTPSGLEAVVVLDV